MLQDAGGSDLFRSIEREIELLDQSVIDEAEHLLMRACDGTQERAATIARKASTAGRRSAQIASAGHREIAYNCINEPHAISRVISREISIPATPWSLGL